MQQEYCGGGTVVVVVVSSVEFWDSEKDLGKIKWVCIYNMNLSWNYHT